MFICQIQKITDLMKFPLRFAGSQRELHVYYFMRETLINFQVMSKYSCKQYGYLW